MAGPVITSSDTRAKTALLFAVGILATLGVVAALVLLWPSGGDGDATSDGTTLTTAADEGPVLTFEPTGETLGEPSERPPTTMGPVDLFTTSDALIALDDLTAAAGDPTQLLEMSLYPDY